MSGNAAFERVLYFNFRVADYPLIADLSTNRYTVTWSDRLVD
jgi:hypothetical protein